MAVTVLVPEDEGRAALAGLGDARRSRPRRRPAAEPGPPVSGTQVTEPGPGEVQAPGPAAPGWSTLWAALADAGCVLLFVVIGRANHDKGETLAGIASTAWPFLAGLALGWFAARAWRRPHAHLVAGLQADIRNAGGTCAAVRSRGTTGPNLVVSAASRPSCRRSAASWWRRSREAQPA